MLFLRLVPLASLLCVASFGSAAEPLPDTKLLTEDGDLAAKMVAGIHKYLDRELADAPKKRDEHWKIDTGSTERYVASLDPNRERLRKILGAVDARLPPHVEFVRSPSDPEVVAATKTYTVRSIRWAVLPGVDGEGLLIEPIGEPIADIVVLPDADQTPEQVVGLAGGVPKQAQFARRLAEIGCRVVVPVMISRKDDLSGNAKLGRRTNLPHREFIHRMAYEMGRTMIGYEVQKVLAVVDWFSEAKGKRRSVGVFGYGEGGAAALYSAALDTRIGVACVSGSVRPGEKIFDEPLDRNLWSLLREFDDGQVARLISPRVLCIERSRGPSFDGPVAKTGRGGAAPGRLRALDTEPLNTSHPETFRLFDQIHKTYHTDAKNDSKSVFLPIVTEKNDFGQAVTLGAFRTYLTTGIILDGGTKLLTDISDGPEPKDGRNGFDATARHKRQFDQLVAHVQKLGRDADAVRKDFFKKADASTPEKWDASCDWYREYLHTEVIGKLPEPKIPLNPRSRQIYDEKDFTGYEVMLDVYDDVFAQGILLLPKGLKPTDKRPVVVCQHGLEGVPRHCIDPEKSPTYFEFARKLVAKGYIVYCPQNPYYGQNTFRQIQRKANPLKLSLFSFIIRQHQRTLDWLETLPNVDKSKIGFYGLSYGGKTAMRVPAIEKRYCLSICAGDFNEWIGKNVSVDLDRSYMWTGEYEMYEFNLGHTFNYAEMAYLIAPRPFMVERGHDDGVGTDEMVASEYAKVRYLYANRLKLPERTTIEFQVGGHRIFLKGTMDFLETHLGKPGR